MVLFGRGVRGDGHVVSLVLHCKSQGFFEKGCRASSKTPSYLCLEAFDAKRLISPPSPSTRGDARVDSFEAEVGEDSLLTNAKLTVGAVSSILRDSNLKKVETLRVEEALALSLQGTVSVCLSAFLFILPLC